MSGHDLELSDFLRSFKRKCETVSRCHKCDGFGSVIVAYGDHDAIILCPECKGYGRRVE